MISLYKRNEKIEVCYVRMINLVCHISMANSEPRLELSQSIKKIKTTIHKGQFGGYGRRPRDTEPSISFHNRYKTVTTLHNVT